jgi:CubicO group peptidase (beta-lactamase class C family)
MKLKSFFFIVLILISCGAFSQNLDTKKLDDLFNSLEKRNEAMGCITISKNGKILYNKAIGYWSIIGDEKIVSNTDTYYRIWSITKTYTAVMIFQLIEEGKLSLETTLDKFYPEIPNAQKITIRHMLSHKSGIFDYVNDTNEEINIRGLSSKDVATEVLSKLKPNFMPGDHFRYSNTNYLLLGYMIETLDDSTFAASLLKRISSKANLKDTHFNTDTITSLTNKASTYVYEGHWKPTSDEVGYSDHLQTADGGVVATTQDMALFIEALFNGKLISKQSLNTILEGEDFYRLGLMKTQFEDKEGYGHTGGWVSESSLFYYPEDNLTISYATNGIVIRKQDILENVLKIYYNKPFAVSMNRNLQALMIFGTGLLIFLILKLKFRKYLDIKNKLRLGLIIALLFWVGSIISGILFYNYNPVRDGITILDSFYSNSGTFMASIQLIVALLFLPFFNSIYKSCKQQNFNIIPLIPLAFIPIYMIGVSLFPFPNRYHSVFANSILLTILSPMLSILLWRSERLVKIRRLSFISFFLIILSIGFIISRATFPEFVHTNWGIIQRLLFLGWTSWVAFLSLCFIEKLNVEDFDEN